MFFKTFGNRKTAAVYLRLSTKTMRVMKLTAILLMAFCLQVAARGKAQSVTFSEKNSTLKRAFQAIEQQTGYVVFVSKQLLQEAKPVTVTARQMPLADFLAAVLKDQSLDYTVEKQTVFIRKKNVAEAYLPPTPITVTGVVTDSTGNALVSATISIKKSKTAAATDNSGRFKINAYPGDVLVVSFVGYGTREYTVRDNQQPITISLLQQSATMADFAINVNTGYQSIPRERATGSYTIVSGKKFENKLRPDLKAALEGQVAGMVLTKEGKLEMRGVSTINAELEPLIIVDGFPLSGGGLELLNVDNIESVTVLKDAVAASIYGARSSNGVIVVTTKQGKKGVMSVGYKGTVGVTLRPDLAYMNRAGSRDYVEAEMDLYKERPNTYLNMYNNYSYLSNVNYLLMAKDNGLMSAAEADAGIEKLKNSDGMGQLQQYLFRNQVTQQHNISLSGGSDKSLVNASVKFIDNKGNIIYTGDKRLILDVKNDWKPAKGVAVRLFTNVNYSTSQAPVRSATDILTYYSNTTFHPYDLVVDPATGERTDMFATNPKKIARYAAIAGMKPMNYNPLNDLGMEKNTVQNLQLRVGGSVNVTVANGLNLEAGGTWTRGNGFNRGLYSKNSYRMRMGYNDGTSISNPAKHYIPDGDMLTESRTVNQAYTLRAQANFNRNFGRHSIIAIAGAELTRDILDNNTYPTRFGYNDQAGTFATFNYADYNAGLYNTDMYSTSNRPQSPVSIGSFTFRDNRFVSWYANESYEYDRRFLVSGSIRLDQTNFFGTDARYRYKPLWSVGGTYKISNEKYFTVPFISKWYVRSSYGINGNIALNTGPFLIVSAGSYSNLTGDIAYTITSPPNSSLRWEKTTTTNVGTDLSLLNFRLNVTLDYYLRRSKALLSNDNIDPTYGYSSLTRNVGQINNSGIELALEGDVLRTKHFTWNVAANIAHNINKVTTYNVKYTSATSVTFYSVNREGYASNSMFSYRYSNIDNNGNVEYFGTDNAKTGGGSVKITDLVYSGTTRPKYAYSVINTLRYKQFDFSFMLIAKTGAIMRRNVFDGNNIMHKDVAKRWRQAGDENHTIYPKLSASSIDPFYFPYSDIFVESANYLKLREASLTYHFAGKLVRKAGLTNASVTLQARNLLLLTANANKQDPEATELNSTDVLNNEMGVTPFRPRPEFYLGLNVNF